MLSDSLAGPADVMYAVKGCAKPVTCNLRCTPGTSVCQVGWETSACQCNEGKPCSCSAVWRSAQITSVWLTESFLIINMFFKSLSLEVVYHVKCPTFHSIYIYTDLPAGLVGPRCESTCSQQYSPCQNGAQCAVDRETSLGYQCVCTDQYQGTYCENKRQVWTYCSCKDIF